MNLHSDDNIELKCSNSLLQTRGDSRAIVTLHFPGPWESQNILPSLFCNVAVLSVFSLNITCALWTCFFLHKWDLINRACCACSAYSRCGKTQSCRSIRLYNKHMMKSIRNHAILAEQTMKNLFCKCFGSTLLVH